MFSKSVLLLLVTLFFSTQFILAQSNEETNIKKVIHTFFEGLHSGDTLKITKVTADNVLMQ